MAVKKDPRVIEFENQTPGWEAEGVEPSPEFKKSGYVAGYKPPAGFFNWMWRLVSRCIGELQEKLGGYAAANEEDKGKIGGRLDKKLEADQFNGQTIKGMLNKVSGLNADLLDGKHGVDFAASGHVHSVASGTSNGFMSKEDKAGVDEHLANRSNPHRVTLAQLGGAADSTLTSHTGNKNNPHGVTREQMGAAAASDLASHVENKDNIHSVTAGQVGLGNVKNVAQMPASYWSWSGQSGQPSYVWGGNAANTYRVWNPLNFSVNDAKYSGYANKIVNNRAAGLKLGIQVFTTVVTTDGAGNAYLIGTIGGGINYSFVSASNGARGNIPDTVTITTFWNGSNGWFAKLQYHDGGIVRSAPVRLQVFAIYNA